MITRKDFLTRAGAAALAAPITARGESIEGGWGRARGLMGGAFMGVMLAQQGGISPSITFVDWVQAGSAQSAIATMASVPSMDTEPGFKVEATITRTGTPTGNSVTFALGIARYSSAGFSFGSFYSDRQLAVYCGLQRWWCNSRAYSFPTGTAVSMTINKTSRRSAPTVKIDSSTYTLQSEGSTSGNTADNSGYFGLFANVDAQGSPAILEPVDTRVKVHFVAVYSNSDPSTPIIDMRPALGPDGLTPGVYDMVGKQFYPGTGTILHGPRI